MPYSLCHAVGLRQTVCMAARAQTRAVRKAPVFWLFLVSQRQKSICTDSVPSLAVAQAGKRHYSLQDRHMVWSHMAFSVSVWRAVPWGSRLGLASSLLSAWLDIPGMNILEKVDWAFFSLRLFLQLTSIRWQFMSKYSLFLQGYHVCDVLL